MDSAKKFFQEIETELLTAFSIGKGSFVKVKTKLLMAYGLGIVILLVIAAIGLYSRSLIVKGFNETAVAAVDIAEMQNLIITTEKTLTPVNDYLITAKNEKQAKLFKDGLNELRVSINNFVGITNNYDELIQEIVPHLGLLEQIGDEILDLEYYEYRKGSKLMDEFDDHGHAIQDILTLQVDDKKTQLSYLIKKNETIVNTLNSIMLTGALIVSFLGMSFVVYLDKNIRSPLEEISTSVKTLDTKKWDKVNVETFNEVSILADEYNKMVDRLKDSYDNLENLVSQRTADLENANSKLEKLALTDGLTGLYNHRHFMESFALELDRCERYGHKLTLMILDIDLFKKYNDTFGHLVGDEVLKCVATTLQGNVREVDFLARYGGEEFCIFLPEIDMEGAMIFAERQRESIEECDYCEKVASMSGNNANSNITISIGMATFPDHAGNVSDLIKIADDALYVAKDNGRNRVEIAGAKKKPQTKSKKSKKESA